jgi:hypothetical protein
VCKRLERVVSTDFDYGWQALCRGDWGIVQVRGEGAHGTATCSRLTFRHAQSIVMLDRSPSESHYLSQIVSSNHLP